MADDSPLGELNEDHAASGDAHVDETERLGNAPRVEVQRQIAVLGLHVLRHFVLNPLEREPLLVRRLEENLLSALHLEDKVDVIASNGILELLLRRLAVSVGQACHVYHI